MDFSPRCFGWRLDTPAPACKTHRGYFLRRGVRLGDSRVENPRVYVDSLYDQFLSHPCISCEKKEAIILRVLTLSLILLLALNLWLTPLTGQVGAGWAVLIAETVQAALFVLVWMKSPHRFVSVFKAPLVR